MTDRQSRIATALDRVFRTDPRQGRGEGEALVQDRIKRIQSFYDAFEPYEIGDIEAASYSLVSASAPGQNPNYSPTAIFFAAEVRRQMGLRLDREKRSRKPALPLPDVEVTPEARKRVAALTAKTVRGLSDGSIEDSAAVKRKALMDRVNVRFDSVREIADAQRHAHGYTTGDPDADDGDMGMMEAR